MVGFNEVVRALIGRLGYEIEWGKLHTLTHLISHDVNGRRIDAGIQGKSLSFEMRNKVICRNLLERSMKQIGKPIKAVIDGIDGMIEPWIKLKFVMNLVYLLLSST